MLCVCSLFLYILLKKSHCFRELTHSSVCRRTFPSAESKTKQGKIDDMKMQGDGEVINMVFLEAVDSDLDSNEGVVF